MDLVKALTLNLSLIITISFVSSLIYERFYENKILNYIFQTIIFMLITVFTIYNPVIIYENFHLDGRTVLISVSTLFYGWRVGIPTFIVAALARFSLSNVNLYSVFGSLIVPLLLGLIFHHFIKRDLWVIKPLSLFLFGMLNSITIFIVLYSIHPINKIEFIEIQRSAMIVFPIITTVLGLVIDSGRTKALLARKIRESEARLRATFHSVDDGMVIIDLNGRIINTNNAFNNLFGLNKDYLKEKNINDTINIFSFENGIEINLDLNMLTTTKALLNKNVIVQVNNYKIPALVSLNSIIDKSLKIFGYVLVIHDIREELAIRDKIIRSEKTLEGIFNTIHEAIYIQDQNGIFLDVNNGAVKMYGYEKKDFIGNSPAFLSAAGKNDHLDLKSILEKVFKGGTEIFEFWGRKKDGTIFPKIVSLYPGEYFGEKVIIAVAVDISVLKEAQEKIIEQEQLLRVLINSTPDIIYVKDGFNKIVEMNNSMLNLLKSMQENLSKDSKAELIEHSSTGFEKIEERTWSNKQIMRTEHKIDTADGFERYFDLISIPLYNDSGLRKNLIMIGRDITLRKKDEEEKQIMLNKLSSVVENFDGGILLEDITGKIEFINDNFIKIFKIKQSKSSLKLSNSEYLVNLIKSSFLNANQFYETIGEIIKSRSVTTGIEFKTLDDRIIEINHFPIQYEKNIVNHLWIIRNITDRRLFEKKLKNQISELERFNKAMIDREIRMIELKKEVNELLNKMGLPAKYQILE